MSKVRVILAGTSGKSVAVEQQSTKGATIGTDFKIENGAIPSQAQLAALLALEASDTIISITAAAAAAATADHGALAGLDDNDHPQYPLKASPETIAGIWTFGDTLITDASDATASGLRLPHGAAPSAPIDGDFWTTTAGVFARVNGATQGLLAVEVNDLTAAVVWANVPDANITESSVTQHEAALTILESQITDGSILARIAGDESISGNWTFQKPLLVDAGTVAVPGIAADGDSNTGIFWPAADAIAHSAGGIEAVRYTELSSAIVQALQADVGLTSASGGQGFGVLLSSYNIFTTVVLGVNHATLPATFRVGTVVYIKNDDSTDSLNVWPASGDDLGEGTDTQHILVAGRGVAFIATAANSTWTQLVKPSTAIDTLDDIGDVNLAGLLVNELLRWNGSAWVPAATLTFNGTDLVVGGGGSIIAGTSSTSPSLSNNSASKTTPTVIPADANQDCGIGGSFPLDFVSIIAGGVTGGLYTEVSGGVLYAGQTDSGLTADVGSSQGDGVILSSYNVYSTVATTGDAATLPATFDKGTLVYVKNDGANSMDVFPASGDDAGSGTDTAVAVAAGESATFIATTANSTWAELIVGGGIEVNDLTAAVTWANVPDANITEGSVTQHEAALTILESQITDGSILARIAANESISGNWTFEGPLLFDAGAVGAPGLGIDGDADTGLFGPAADALAQAVGGIEAIRFTEASSSVLQAPEANVGLTADVGSSQGDGVITSSYNVYSTVANVGDAATLPATFIIDTLIFIKNDGANSMDVFPASGDDAGSGTDTAVAVAAGESAAFIATAANSTWTPFITGVPGATGATGAGAILGHSGANSVIAKGSTDYIGFGSGGVQSVEADGEFYVPRAGTVRNLRTYVSANASNNAGNNITIRKNGSGTSLGTTYGAAETGLKSDTSDSFTVVAGDRIAIEVVNAGSGGGNKDIALETVTLELG